MEEIVQNCSTSKMGQPSGKFCQFKALFCNIEIKENAILMKQICMYELKNNSIYSEMFFCGQILLA